MSLIDLNVFETEPAEIYHAKSKDYLSSHQLIEFMQCPYLYQKHRAGLIDEKEPSAFLIGRAAHCRILEGQRAVASHYERLLVNVTRFRWSLVSKISNTLLW
jgi:hypothetical protein